jgi:holin-like protein
MRGFAILLAFNLLGLVFQKLGVPLPGTVIGLIAFTGCLFAGWIKLDSVEPTANFLLRHMLLFFAPVIVGAIAFLPVLRREWPAVAGGVVGSMLVVLVVTGLVADRLMKLAPADQAPARDADEDADQQKVAA